MDTAALTKWLPESDDDRLQVGFRIIQEAYRSKVSGLDNEIRSLRISNDEYKASFANLQKRSLVVERELAESNQKVHHFQEELRNANATNKALSKQIEKYRRLQATFAEALEHSREEVSGQSETSLMSEIPSPILRSAPIVSSHSALPNRSSADERVDGKAFFRSARSRLSHENFNAFLAAIKSLNSHTISKDEVVGEVRKIFGDADDLMSSFMLLINRHS